MSTDGPEEREFEREEAHERYLDELALDEQLADESLDDMETPE